MSRKIRTAVAAVGTFAALISTTQAHVDDPKLRDRQPPYTGPGYSSATDQSVGIDFPASNVQLLAWIPVTTFNPGNTSAATVEGYVSPSGREYAVVGLSDGTGFVEVTNPGSPVIVEFIPGPDSLWKDVRVFQHYAYSVSEGGGGIQIMDMSQIDLGTVTLVGTSNTPTGTNSATHTMFINQASGRLYRAGGGSNGLRIYSLADPTAPAFLGAWPDRYVHEVTVVNYTSGPYAGKEIAFCCGGFNGGQVDTGVYIVDINNLLDGNPNNGNPLLSYFQYSSASFSHQGWLSENKQLFYLNDELDEPQITSLTRVINVSNLSAPFQAGSFTSGTTSVDHNLYVKGNIIFEANYRSGLRIFDASTDAINPTQIGFFDTWPEDDASNFNGLWDNYPYLPSGIVLGSDIEKGFFIWKVGVGTLAFAYPNGTPTQISPIGASVNLQINGQGGAQVNPATATLHYSFGQTTQSVPLTHNGGNSYTANFGALPCGADVSYYFTAQTVAGFDFTDPPSAPAAPYQASASIGTFTDLNDEMETNSGWVAGAAGDTATTGIWVRVDPVGSGAQPENDHTPNPGVACWVTGQGVPGGGLGDNDVDNGITTLVSPTLNAIAQAGDPYVVYHRWYSNSTGGSPNADVMPVSISNNNGQSWVLLENVADNANAWVRKSFRIADYVTPTSQIKLRFVAQDLGQGSVVEAGVDDVQIIRFDCDGDVIGDVTGDGVVNVNDLLAVINGWGACPPSCPADLNGDDVVNVADLLIVITNWS